MVNARPWVPQSRERVFIAGFRRDIGARFSMDDVAVPGPPRPVLGDILIPDGEVDPKYGLSEAMWQCLLRHAERHSEKGNGFGYGLCGPDDVARTLMARYHKDGSEILIRPRGDERRGA